MPGAAEEPTAHRSPLIGTILMLTDDNQTYRYETSFDCSAPFAINGYC